MKKHFIFILIYFVFLIPISRLTAQIPEFKILVLQFTDNLNTTSLKKSFDYKKWKKRFLKITKAKHIARHLLILEKNVKANRKKSSWDDKKKQWRKRTSNALSISEVAHALYNFEINLEWKATKGGWSKKRRLWVKRVKSLY